MSVFDPVFEAVNSVSILTGRIFHAQALKNASPPFAFWEDLSGSEQQALDGYTGLCKAAGRIHIVAAKRAQLDPAARNVRSAIIAMQGTSSGGYLYERINLRQASPEIHEKEVNLFRIVYDFEIDYQEVSVNE